MAFTTLVVLELVAVQVIRSPYGTRIFSNPYIIAAVSTSFFLQLWIIYHSFFQNIFNTTALDLKEWGVIAAITLTVWVFCAMINRLFKSYTERVSKFGNLVKTLP